uniref:C2H2-type domain-containing protein n=1 Tax=Oncorhynchus kisutch TaxID=8019 RepID=A0A8C7GEJ2_ONCKI
MEESWDSIEEAGDYKTDAARHLPSCSCQQITEHKGTEVGEEILTDKTYKSMTAFKVKNDEGSAPFSDIHSHSKIMAQDLQRKAAERRATEVTHDKCPSFSERSCSVGLTNVQEICILSSGFDVKKIRGRDSAAVEVGTIVSPPPFSSSLSKNIKGNVTLSPTEKIAVTQGLSASSLSDHARFSREVVDKKTYADVSHQTLPLADTKKGKEKMSFNTLLPVMEKQQKRKAGRPYKKKTLVKMAKLLAIGQERYSDATEIHGVTHHKDTLTPSRKQTKEKKKDEMFPPTTSSDTWFGCNSTSDSSNHLTIAHSDDIISASQIAGPSISMELNQPSRIQKTSKTTQKEEFKITEVSALKLTTVTKGQYSPIEQALTHNTLVPPENALKVQKRTGRNKTMISKGGNRRTQAFKRNRMNPSSLFTPQSQSSNATPQEKNNSGLSQDETPLQSSDIKMEPKYLSDTSVLDVTNNVKEHQKREPPSKNFTEGNIKSPGIMSKCFDLSITQKDQGARSDMKREIKDNVTANISAVGNQGEMTPRTQELSRLKSIEDVLKLKRKAGRPFKKNRLFKMDKLVAIAQEGRTNDPENSGMTKECVPKFPAYHPLKSKVKKEKTDTQTLASNSPTSPSRRSNRTCKTTPKTVQKMQVLTHTLAQSVLSVPSNLIELKSEDTTLMSSTVSPILLCSAEIFPQQESHRCGKPPKKNTKVNKHMTTAVPHPPIFAVVSKTLAEIVSTGNGKEAKKDIGSKRKYKRVPGTRGVSELLCTNGIPQGDIHTQTNRDEVYSKTSAPTVPQSQNTRKREVKNKKGTEKAAVPLSDETVLPVSDCQVQSHSATPLLPSKIKTQSDTLYLTPRTVRKKNPKTCKEIKKTSPKVEKAQVPSLDPSLGVEHRCHDVPHVDQMRQVEAVIESVIEDLHKPLKHVSHRKTFKEKASNVLALTLNPSLGVEHRTPDVPQVDHIRQMEAVIESVMEDLHKKDASNVAPLKPTTFSASDNLLEQHNNSTLPQSSFMSCGETKSGLKHAIPKTSTKNKSKTLMNDKLTCKSYSKNSKKAAMQTSVPTSDTMHVSTVKKNSNICQERKRSSQKAEKAQDPSLGVEHKSPEMDQWREEEALIDSVNENLHKLLKHKDQQKKLQEEASNVSTSTVDPSLVVEHGCPDRIRQVEAVIDSLIEDLHKPLKPNGQQKKFKEETSNISALEQTAFLTSDNLLEQQNHCTLPQYYLLTKSGLKHAKPKMSTKMKSKACSKGKLFKHAKKAAVITSDPSIGAENGCLEMPSHFTQAERGGKGDVKTNKCVGKHEKEAVISVTGDHLETAAHKPHQRKGPRKKLKEEDSSVSKPEQVESTTSDSQLRQHDHNDSQQVSLLVSAAKTESGIEHIMPEMEMTNKPKTCRKRKILSKQSSKITETPTPLSSKPSLGVEYRYSEMATPFTHVDQVQNILDTPKGSKASNGNTGSNHPISNVRHSRRPSKSNSHITTDLIQDQAILSVASHLTNQPTSPVSTTVSSTAAQGQITELVSSLCTDKRPHKIGRPPKKKKSQRPKRTGIDKNITDDDKVCVQFLSAFVKEELIEEEKSLENRGKEKNGKGKKGKILQTDNVKVKDGNALADDKLVLQVPIDDAGDSISIAIDPISAVIPKHKKGGRIAKGKRVQKIASTPNIPSDQQCMNMSTEEMSLCLSNISEKHRKRKVDSSSADFVNADINVLNLKDDLSDRSEILDSSLLGTQRVKNKGKIKSKTITEEQTVATSVVKEMVWLDLQTTIAALKKKRGRPFKKSTLMRMAKQRSCEQQKSNTSRKPSVNKTQSCKSIGISTGGKMHKFNPMSTTSRRHTRASVAMKNEDLVLKQQQDDIWEITNVSSNIFFPIVTNSRSISVQEIETSETIFSVDAGATQGIQQVESTPLTTPLTKLPHKVTGVKKRRRRNKTGWATKVKSKRPLSKVNCGGTLEVFVQSSIDNTGLSFNSSLCNSLTENDTLESVEQERECRAHVKAVTNYNRVCVEKEINCGDQPLTARAKLQHSSVLLHNLKTRKPMSCHFCSRSFRHITAYTIHKRIHTGVKPYSCQKCGKSFAHLSKLKSHSNIHKQHGPIQCPCCITQSPNKDDLIDHFKIHMKGTKRFSLINKTRRDKEIQIHPYTDYIESPVTLNGRKFLRCSTCLKYFFSKATLKLHLQTHSGVRRFTCKVCGKMFITFSSFNAHEKTHWPVKPYACSVCGKGFVLLRELKTHSHMHSGEMPFFCNHCGQAFSDFSSLRTHQVSKVCFEARDEGDGSKVDIEGFLVEQRADGQINTPMYFKCQICKQLNRRWCQYILHLQTHTNNKPNLCEICGQRYEVPELCVHCKVCCKSSGEERACNSSLSEVWHEPQSLQNPMHVTDFLYNANQEMLSTDDQHPKCKESEPLPPLETMEEYSSDVLPQNPKPACQIPGNGLEINRPSPSNSMCASSAILSPSVMSCNSVRVVQQPSGFHSRFQTHAPCDRYPRGQCGKSFNRWNKLWLHQGRHREKRCSFSCTQCNLEFRFLGSYREHMQEHAAQRPYVCPLCPKTYITEEDLNTHLCENHQPCESLKCDTCEKGFTSFRNLERHRLLHRAASSHYCLPCKLPFPSYLALKNHLKAHKARPVIPLPEGPLEPLRFPYHCRKCNARFTTTDLLQAHQVCHLIGGKKTYSSSTNVVSASLTSKLSNKPRARITPLSPTTVPSLLLSKKRNMYRYPHPDRLYVVPKISSQPPVIVSDTEEEPQEILNFSLSSPCNTVSLEHEGQTSPSNNCEANNSDLPQCSCPSCVLIYEPTQCMPKTNTPHMPTHEPPCPLDKGHQNVPPQRWKKSKGNDDAFFRASTTFVISRAKKQRIGFECADCWVRFSDVSELHEHYLHHARGDLSLDGMMK